MLGRHGTRLGRRDIVAQSCGALFSSRRSVVAAPESRGLTVLGVSKLDGGNSDGETEARTERRRFGWRDVLVSLGGLNLITGWAVPVTGYAFAPKEDRHFKK